MEGRGRRKGEGEMEGRGRESGKRKEEWGKRGRREMVGGKGWRKRRREGKREGRKEGKREGREEGEGMHINANANRPTPLPSWKKS